ncbi:Ribonucleases P/MRP protein subunit pop1 [Pleosporales sp. CAS-2024a]
MADPSNKRKQPPEPSSHAKRPRLAMRPQHHIPAQPTRSAYPDGEVNVRAFLQSHEHEIQALEHAMRSAKKGLSRRAFQHVPRELRRRTASHNPQRVPKRLRARARQEAKEDNTPIARGKSGSGVGTGPKAHLRQEGREKSKQRGQQRARKTQPKHGAQHGDKMDMDGAAGAASAATSISKPATGKAHKARFPALATPATPPSRFRRRQKDKTWLPTHVWHAKRARMTAPTDPLWRFAMALQPVIKAYRLTHRAVTQRGAIAWDTSYMSTISLQGGEASIVAVLTALSFAAEAAEDPWQTRGRAKKWMRGTRVCEGWLYTREPKPHAKMALVTVIWCVPAGDSKKRKVFIRVHPSAFMQLWDEIVSISKAQKPSVTVEDLRFEIGSIEIMGPSAAEALSSVLTPSPTTDTASEAPQSIWPTLGSITDVGSLPLGAMLAFDMSDPRFADPPKTAQLAQDEQSCNTLMDTLAQWPVDVSQGPASIFDRNLRLTAQRAMPSDKSINRRKRVCTLGEIAEALPSDPRIPTLLYTSRESKSWTVLLPWKCVMAVWRVLMRYPLSTGGNPRFGGLKERRQVNYERSMPQFPFDYPGTDAGWAWELREREKRKHEWTKRPKGKRVEWTTLYLGSEKKGELGDPWACDWDLTMTRAMLDRRTMPQDGKRLSPFLQLSARQANALLAGASLDADDYFAVPHLFTVKITMTERGIPTDCTRVYRLPSDKQLRDQWLALARQPGTRRPPRKQRNDYASDVPAHMKRRELARRLLEAQPRREGPPKAGDEGYPAVPGEEHLIGFVTTGNYNLAEGVPTAIANLALHRVLPSMAGGHGVQQQDRVCIVRRAGSTVGRLATWEAV